MSKPLLESSESSDEELDQIKVNNDFAQRYDNWRRKEEIQKLKDKYGTNLDVLSDSEQEFISGSEDSDDSDSSDESVGDQQVFDDNFFKVYSALKSKNPIIYDKNVKFFDEKTNNEKSTEEVVGNDNEKKMTLKDYHVKLIKEKKGITEEDERTSKSFDVNSNGYYEELNQIRNEFKAVLDSDQNEDSDEELLKGKTKPVKTSPNKSNIIFNDNQNDSDINFLQSYWKSDQLLEESERYLRDYIINKRYVETPVENEELYVKPERKEQNSDCESEGNNGLLTIDDVNKKPDIDIKINEYHFEDANAQSLKRYPRNAETIRDLTNAEKKSIKRSETKERKKKEKERELKRLRKLKREEMKARLKKLQEISGNDKLDFNDLDWNLILDDEQEFDSEKYDQKMQSLFGSEYYNTGNEKEGKPQFEYDPDIDDFDYEDQDVNQTSTSAKTIKLLEKKQKKINRAMEEVGIFEDLVGGDLPTRFKYRTVEPIDFGLTDEEILFSDDKDLNKWCSVKKMSQYREVNEEKNDKKTYSSKASNVNLKRKILKSYFEREKEVKSEDMNVDLTDKDVSDVNNQINNVNDVNIGEQRMKKKRKRKQKKSNSFIVEPIVKTSDEVEKNEETNVEESDPIVTSETIDETKEVKKEMQKKFRKHKKQKTFHKNEVESPYPGVSVDRLKAYGLSNRKIKKIKHKNRN